MTDDRSEDRRRLAAEYALGALEGAELKEAQALASSDREFREEVARWSGRMAPLLDEIAPVAPPDSVWRRIEARIGPANDNVTVLQRRIGLWRGIAAGAMTLAASLAIVLVTQPQSVAPPAGPPMVAMLGDRQEPMKVVASWDPGTRQLVLAVPAEMPADPSQSHELWVIPADGKPRSLGTMPAGKRMHMRLADALAQLLQQGATIAISVEPAGGSPTGAPTGPVVASGALSRA
jgi:anti-sigma-K factor RskA